MSFGDRIPTFRRHPTTHTHKHLHIPDSLHQKITFGIEGKKGERAKRTTYLHHVAGLKTRGLLPVFLTRNTGAAVLGWRENFYRSSFCCSFRRFVYCFWFFCCFAIFVAKCNIKWGTHHCNKFPLKYSTSKLANVHTTASVMLRLKDLVLFQLV